MADVQLINPGTNSYFSVFAGENRCMIMPTNKLVFPYSIFTYFLASFFLMLPLLIK